MAQGEGPGIHSGVRGRIDAASPNPATDPRRVALHLLAAETRRLIDGLVATAAPADVLESAAAEVRAAADRFEGYGQGSLYGFAEVANAGGEPGAMFDHSPLIGKANPLAPPLLLEINEDQVVGEVTFGAAYEGPPGCVHGGYVAAMFDELLGAAQSLSGSAGMTGTLTIRYRRPTPLHTLLRVSAGLDRVEGRKIFVKGVCVAGGEQVSEAEGIFISIDPERFANLKADREQRVAGRQTPRAD
jgi:acyl-coenzyme A thioesterase PaaI-like protein